MKVLSVLRADSVRAVRTLGGTFGYFPDAMRPLITKYAFIGLPTTEELLPSDPSKGFGFKHGKVELNGKWVLIDLLQIYPNGLSVTTRTNTSDGDAILDDVMAWAASEFKVSFEPIKPGTGHSSQLEVRFDESLPHLLPFLSTVGETITKGLDDFWELRPLYELVHIDFWFDKTKYPQFAPPAFRVDRRENVDFEQNVYFCEAPMSTDNHIATLAQLEKACVDAFK